MSSEPPEENHPARLRKLEKCTNTLSVQIRTGIGIGTLLIGAVITTGVGQWQASIANGERVEALRETVSDGTASRRRSDARLGELRDQTREQVTSIREDVSGLRATVAAGEKAAEKRDERMSDQLVEIRRAVRNRR